VLWVIGLASPWMLIVSGAAILLGLFAFDYSKKVFPGFLGSLARWGIPLLLLIVMVVFATWLTLTSRQLSPPPVAPNPPASVVAVAFNYPNGREPYGGVLQINYEFTNDSDTSALIEGVRLIEIKDPRLPDDVVCDKVDPLLIALHDGKPPGSPDVTLKQVGVGIAHVMVPMNKAVDGVDRSGIDTFSVPAKRAIPVNAVFRIGMWPPGYPPPPHAAYCPAIKYLDAKGRQKLAICRSTGGELLQRAESSCPAIPN